jgi:hypothetical protein
VIVSCQPAATAAIRVCHGLDESRTNRRGEQSQGFADGSVERNRDDMVDPQHDLAI